MKAPTVSVNIDLFMEIAVEKRNPGFMNNYHVIDHVHEKKPTYRYNFDDNNFKADSV